MEPLEIIQRAIGVILGQDYVLPEVINDQCFLGDIMLKIEDLLRQHGPPTIKMRNRSIEIGELTAAECERGHNTFMSHAQFGSRNGESLWLLAKRLFITDPDEEHASAAEYGQTYDFAVCQACPAFIDAIHKVHTAGFTADDILERAKAYWIDAFGFWE